MTIDVTASDEQIADATRQWLTFTDDDGQTRFESMWLGDDFCYDSGDYESHLDGILGATLGYQDDQALFTIPTGIEFYVDLVAGGDMLIGGVRYIIAPVDGPLATVNLATNYIDIKHTTNDRSAAGVEAVVSIVVCAAQEWRRLLAAYREIVNGSVG